MDSQASSTPTLSRGTRWIVGAVVAAGLFAGGYFLGRSSVAPAAATSVRETSGPLGEQSRRSPGDPFALGDPDAPVTMVVFSDYRCPFCARYANTTEPAIVERFVNTGKVRLEWRDFPIFGDASMLAARAGRAAAAQGKFWEFNAAVYGAAPEIGHHDLTPAKLVAFAAQVGVPDLERFESDMNSEQYDASIAIDAIQARNLGITGTPSFVIDGNPIVGAQPTSVFVGLIEQALAGK
ncbi:MAG TPA: thioredoxin domain-containing protein [Trueperaceae bacterium]|nr:thioredoxin domain-containing protein [Trueperaceae bacterium]